MSLRAAPFVFNTAIYAMKTSQAEMKDIENVSESDVMDMIKDIFGEGADDESKDDGYILRAALSADVGVIVTGKSDRNRTCQIVSF